MSAHTVGRYIKNPTLAKRFNTGRDPSCCNSIIVFVSLDKFHYAID
jgi:hypothetical protein